MLTPHRFVASLLLLTAVATARADDLLPQARRLIGPKPSAAQALGLAEMQRAAGRVPEALETLSGAGLHEALCWRLAAGGAPDRDGFRNAVALLKKEEGPGGWAGAFELYLAYQDGDRAALLAAADGASAPKNFPTVAAEKAHLALLRELGLPRTRAGLEVIAARSFEPVYALRDLDRGLSREAAYLRSDGREADAKKLEVCRDRLREAYLAASHCLVERLFALSLLDRTKERAALLADAQAIPYLGDREKLEQAFARLDADQAWSLVVGPMLADEVHLIQSPPDLDKVRAPAVAELGVHADRKTVRDRAVVYEGAVRATVGPLRIACDRLTVVRDGEQGPAVLAGAGAVAVEGVPGCPGGVRADRFSLSTDVGSFTFGGDVRLKRVEGELKLRACTVNRAGAVGDRRSLLDDFHDAGVTSRLDLLAPVTKVYTDEELPAEVRYLLALSLLRPHLSWHAAYPPPRLEGDKVKVEEVKQLERLRNDGPWQEAHAGEDWMRADVQRETKDALRQALEQAGKGDGDELARRAPSFFWRIKDRDHADIARAARLLEGVKDGDFAGSARRWLEEVKRNNTFLTLDVVGGYAAGADGPVVLDARNVDKATFKLYRIRKPEDLLWVEGRVGRDFVYDDHGLQYGERPRVGRLVDQMAHARDSRDRRTERALPNPDFLKQEPVLTWDARPGDLKVIDLSDEERHLRRDREDEDDEESRYFDDACGNFRDRLERTYCPRNRAVSSWQCGRIVVVPGKALAEAGAYVLAVEGNGEVAYAPLLVDPLSLTLRRCRDGVFALASDHEGKKPVSGAQILGRDMLGEAATDGQGAAFARLYAAGDRAVIVHKDSRFAVGGFGRVFDGIYLSPLDRELRDWYRGGRFGKLKMADEKQGGVKLYGDRWVIAALTDRPTYRPGQRVQFKLIVRRLAPAGKAAEDGKPRAFRADDFDIAGNLQLPENGAKVPYAVLDPHGRVVAEGALTLNDFGTAAGTAELNAEAAVGAYTLRVDVGDAPRLVPDAFAVQYYRLPNFRLSVEGVPEKVKEITDLKITLSGEYYFGKPVAGGRAEVRLVRPDQWRPLARAEAVLDDAGMAAVTLTPDKDLSGGKYAVVVGLTDDSGRTVSRSLPFEVDRPESPRREGLLALPRFATPGTALEISTGAVEVVAEQWGEGEKGAARHQRFAFQAEKGKAVVKLTAPGWYTLTANQETTDLFVYGGADHPFETWTTRDQQERDAKEEKEGHQRHAATEAAWVDLTEYRSEENGYPEDLPFSDGRLLALFDRRHAEVGGKLSVLVYTPCEHPRLVFTVEGRTVLDYFLVEPPDDGGAYHVVEIPITKRCLPNFYLQGRVVSGKDSVVPWWAREWRRSPREKELEKEVRAGEDPRWCRVDVIDPKQAPGEEKLQVEVIADRKDHKPGDPVEVRVRVLDRDGKPTAAEVSLAAVDESIYVFGEDRAPGLAGQFSDPHPPQQYARKTWRGSQGNRWLAEKRRLEKWTQGADHLRDALKMQREQAMQEAKDGASALDLQLAAASPATFGGEMPAGSLPEGRLRLDFRETAAWLPQLRTGEDGFAKASFKLPDSLTQYRLTAVALTKETKIGVGKSSLRASLPLAVQVFLPRFAVESDRLTTVGLVHNNGPRDRVCELTWEVQGAGVDGPEGVEDWKTETAGDKVVGRGKVAVAAGKSARVALRLKMDAVGSVKVVFRAADAADADAETRTLTVQPLGREREVTFDGRFTGREKVKLPAGFTAREVTVVLARGDAARALDGVGGLIDYPYGCVEQTMSRFLPAVVVKQATRQAAVQLPPEAAAKLPDVLSRGLTRLYNFQHDDGGWGWWEHDATDSRMTAYVVYGLARCRMAGVQVDAGVLSRGCGWLRQALRDGKLPDLLAARVHLALALAGEADAEDLDKRASAPIADPETRCRLALACRAVGLNERAERLWAGVRDWRPEATEPVALKLSAGLAFGAPLEECQAEAARLTALRTGLGWESTAATSAAIDALSGMMGYLAGKSAAKSVRVAAGGKVILDVTDAAERKKLVFRTRLVGDRLPAADGLEIELTADCDGPVFYTVVAAGVQRLDKVEPVGKEIKVARRLETLSGKPLEGRVRVGDVFAVRLTVDLEAAQDYVLLEERRPAGCEFADERIVRQDPAVPAHVEFRDDRACVFYGALSAGRHEVVYYLRAETPGVSHVLPGCAYPMYAPTVRGETNSAQVEVEEAGR